jgi:hypothetical protein
MLWASAQMSSTSSRALATARETAAATFSLHSAVNCSADRNRDALKLERPCSEPPPSFGPAALAVLTRKSKPVTSESSTSASRACCHLYGSSTDGSFQKCLPERPRWRRVRWRARPRRPSSPRRARRRPLDGGLVVPEGMLLPLPQPPEPRLPSLTGPSLPPSAFSGFCCVLPYPLSGVPHSEVVKFW